MYSTHNKGKSVFAERFVRTLKNKYMNSISKNKYNNTYRTIKLKPVDLNQSMYINSSKGINDKDPKFKIGDIARISKYKNVFTKGYVPNWSEEVFVIKKVKNIVPGTYVISDLKGKEIVGRFYKKELQKTNEKEFKIEKVNKRKGDKLYAKWKGYNNSFNSWIAKKDIVHMSE